MKKLVVGQAYNYTAAVTTNVVLTVEENKISVTGLDCLHRLTTCSTVFFQYFPVIRFSSVCAINCVPAIFKSTLNLID